LLREGERGEGKFKEISWPEALDRVAEALSRAKQRYGAASRMRIGGSGACRGALHNTASLTKRFLSLAGGYTDTYGSFSSEASDFVKPFMYGTKYVGLDAKTLLDTELLVLWGFNPADTRFGTETEGVIAELRDRGVPIVVIDPRRSSTVKRYRAEWIPINPGSDGAMMLALLYLFLQKGLVKREYLSRYGSGFEELEEYIIGGFDGVAKTPQWAARYCGLSAERIIDFGTRLAAADPAALLAGLSVQRTLGGEEADRLAGVLQLALGNVGRPGGSTGAGQWNVIPGPRCGKIPVPENPAGSEVPVYRWADAALGNWEWDSPSEISLLYNVGGNYLVQGSDVRKNMEAFRQADFVVTHDYFLTDTARFSDVVLPVTTFVERRDILFSNSNYLFFSEQAIPPLEGTKNDWDIFVELAERLGFRRRFDEGRSTDQWIETFLEESEVSDPEEFFRTGIYAGEDQSWVGLSDFIAEPEGQPLATESGKIEISSPRYQQAGGSAFPVFEPWVDREDLREYPFFLITPHEKMRNNSQFDNIREFSRQVDRRVWLNREDAESLEISDGDTLGLASLWGELRARAKVTEDIKPGVVSLSQGAWLIAREQRGWDNPNYLTSTTPTLPSQGARTHSTKVKLWKTTRRS